MNSKKVVYCGRFLVNALVLTSALVEFPVQYKTIDNQVLYLERRIIHQSVGYAGEVVGIREYITQTGSDAAIQGMVVERQAFQDANRIGLFPTDVSSGW